MVTYTLEICCEYDDEYLWKSVKTIEYGDNENGIKELMKYKEENHKYCSCRIVKGVKEILYNEG